MKIAFVLTMVFLFIVLTAISIALFKHSRRGWWIWGGILLVGFVLLWHPISDLMDPWFLESVGELSISEVVSAREFTVQGWANMERHIVLAGTRLPDSKAEQDAAKAGLLKLLGEKKRVVISFPHSVCRMPEPWPANVTSGGVSVNEHMLTSRFLLTDGTTLPQRSGAAATEGDADAAGKVGTPDRPTPHDRAPGGGELVTASNPAPKQATARPDAEKAAQTGKDAAPPELPTWARFVLWALAGFFGATSLGMVLNKRYHGFAFLLLIGGLAIRSIVLSSQSGTTVWPPIVCLIIIVVFAGAGRMANKEFLEDHPSFRKPIQGDSSVSYCSCNPVSSVSFCSCNPVCACVPVEAGPAQRTSSTASVRACVCVPVGAGVARSSHPVSPHAEEPMAARLQPSEAIELLRQHRRLVTSAEGSYRSVLEEPPLGDRVDCSVFAPPQTAAGTSLLVQVFAHCPEHAEDAAVMAREFDEDATRRGFRSLEKIIARGALLTFHLEFPTLIVDEPIQKLVWSGHPASIQFGVTVPPGRRPGNAIGTVTVSSNSVPVGHIKFTLKVVHDKAVETKPVPLGDQARAYSMAFVSYATADRVKVIPRVQMLRAVGIDYFQDILDLEPGARWEQKLYERIDTCDLFLLFWSSAAKDSEWVMREVQYAMDRKGGDDLKPPEIRPVIVEGPPIVPPPQILSHLHFGDSLAYFLVAEDQIRGMR